MRSWASTAGSLRLRHGGPRTAQTRTKRPPHPDAPPAAGSSCLHRRPAERHSPAADAAGLRNVTTANQPCPSPACHLAAGRPDHRHQADPGRPHGLAPVGRSASPAHARACRKSIRVHPWDRGSQPERPRIADLACFGPVSEGHHGMWTGVRLPRLRSPSTTTIRWAVMNPAPSEARKLTARAMSPGVPIRPADTEAR